jgi:hypothetical protein
LRLRVEREREREEGERRGRTRERLPCGARRVSDSEGEKAMAGIGPIRQDWEPVVVRKKAPTAAAKKDEKAVNAARRSGAEIETMKKCEWRPSFLLTLYLFPGSIGELLPNQLWIRSDFDFVRLAAGPGVRLVRFDD